MKHQSQILGAMMATFTLILVVLFPMLSRPGESATPIQNAPVRSPHEQALDNQRSPLVQVAGGTYFRGTMPDEAERALELCDGCDISSAEDSYPAHRVNVPAFWMETTEVNYGQYVAFLNTLGAGGHLDGCLGEFCALTQAEDETSAIAFNGVNYTLTNSALATYPVVDVTWYGAQAYCESLGRRLPTEAEWEYAARGVTGTRFPWGDEWTPEAANVRGAYSNGDGVIIAGPQPVGGYPNYASRDGVRDMAGNVAEWVADWYAADWYLQVAPEIMQDTGPETGTSKVVRGGSWDDSPFYARSMQRDHLPPTETSNKVGFRCVG